MGVQQLPRGRHGLTREEVAEAQRERMLRAMAQAVAERGYAKTPVAEVLRRAGVSRETFYEHFANKEECFIAAYHGAAGIVLGAVAGETGAASGTASFAERLDRGLARYLALLASEPAIARTFLVEVYAAGPEALAQRVVVQRRFTAAVAALVGASTDAQRFGCEALVGAISALVTQRVCDGRFDELEALHAPLLAYLMTTLDGLGLRP